jgi:diguanylate cyclase (GGDEF)-like protein
MADVYGQKAINDIKGHAAGNEMLRLMLLVLRNAFRVEDVVARIGEDGFAVLLPGTDNATVKEILKRIRSSVMAQNRAYAHLPLNLSLGAATAEKGDSLAATLKQAEREMSLEREKGPFLANAQGENKEDGGTLEEELRKHRDHPEELIEKRTEELKKANQQLQQNITERKHAEEMLRNSEISYRRLFEGREISMCGSKARIGGDTFGHVHPHRR